MADRALQKFAILAPTLVGALLFGIDLANANRVAHHLVLAGGVEIGGMDAARARAVIAARADAIRGIPITFSRESFSDARTLGTLGVSIDEETTLAYAWSYGRRGPLLTDLLAQTRALVVSTTILPIVRIDEQQFASSLDELLGGVDRPAQDARIDWDAGQQRFNEIPEASGTVADRSAIRDALRSAAQADAPAHIPLKMTVDIPNVTLADLEGIVPSAEAALARAPKTLEAGGVRVPLEPRDVGPWITTTARSDGTNSIVDLAVNRETIRAYLENAVTPKVNREPVNARFRMEGNRVVAFAFARNGQTLDLNASVSALEEALLRSGVIGETLALPVVLTPPEVGNDAAEALGVRELLSVGETDFRGSPQNRIHNIRVGASRYDGVLIEPGKEFSFNTLLGAVDAETGYKPELVIKQDKTIPEYGGGLCQVSTTAFRAAVNAGLTITERKSHAYIVRYYGTPGFDATIYPPHPDLRFVNDTPGHILIQTQVVGTKLRFEFYGTNDGRTVAVEGPVVYDRKEDGSAKATLTLRVTMPDGTMNERVFRSTYRSPSLFPIERRNPLE